MAIGATAFTVSFLLAAVQHSGASSWAITFTAFTIVVVEIDLKLNVVNVNRGKNVLQLLSHC